VLLSFAQFEREITGERIRDKIASSKRKGMWMGGPPPLGYDVKDRKLIINDDEAENVRLIFDTFIMKRGVELLVIELKRLGIKSKFRITTTGKHVGGNTYDAATLYKLLNNQIYLGKIKHKDQIYEGQHEAIITQDTWNLGSIRFFKSAHARAAQLLSAKCLRCCLDC
jgi:site-specific DNA recombinase